MVVSLLVRSVSDESCHGVPVSVYLITILMVAKPDERNINRRFFSNKLITVRQSFIQAPFVHLSNRPSPSIFYIFDGPSSESVHEVDGLSSSTSVYLGQITMIRCPNPSTRPPQNDNLGPASGFVHEVDGLRTNFGPLSTWTGRRPSSSIEDWFEYYF